MISLFLKTWGALIIAATALAQPWLIASWKKFMRRGKVDLFETGEIEVGFSQLGPTIGLHGVLRAEHRDLFIRKADINVVRRKDSAKHTFEWTFFCGYQGTLSNPQDVTIELASGFLLRVADPYRYRILFSDVNTRTESNNILSFFKAAWDSKRTEVFQALAQIQSEEVAHQQSLPILWQGAYQQFQSCAEHVTAFSELGKVFYWEPGEYVLELTVHTIEPQRSFSWKWAFSLTKADSDGLRLNILSVLQAVCLGETYYQHFAYPQYQDIKHDISKH